MLDDKYYYKVDGNENILIEHRKNFINNALKPFISLPYEIADVLLKACAEEYKKYKIEDNAALLAKDSNLEDVRWILTHFINKDKK